MVKYTTFNGHKYSVEHFVFHVACFYAANPVLQCAVLINEKCDLHVKFFQTGCGYLADHFHYRSFHQQDKVTIEEMSA